MMTVETTTQGGQADTAALIRQIAGFRRRLGVLAFRRFAPPLAVVAIVATEAAIVAIHPAIRQATVWFGGAVALGVAMAGTIALVRIPSLHATAAVLDRRLRLEDRIVTALQFARDSDVVSRLIVRDASERLAKHPPMALSATPQPRLGWLAIVGAAASLLFALAVLRAPFVFQGDTSAPAGASSTDAPGGPRQSRPGAGPSATSSEAGTAASVARAQIGRDGVARRAPQDAAATSAPPGAGVLSGASTSSRNDSAAGQRAGTRGDVQPGSQRGAEAGSGVGTAGRSVAGGDRGGHGSGAGGGATAGTETGAGGVKGGMPAASARQPAARRLPDGPNYSAQYWNARTRAEAAIAQERVPARLRRYIRDYFLALQPTGRQ
jgi:hypothetical protein